MKAEYQTYAKIRHIDKPVVTTRQVVIEKEPRY